MKKTKTSLETDTMFDEAERAGMKLAIKGRLAAVIIVGLWLMITRGFDRAPDFLLGTLVFAGLGVLHFKLIGSAYDRPWLKYVFITIDIVLFSLAVALLPPTPETDLPQILIFRFDVHPFYYILLGVAAFSFSPGLVLWTGIIGAISWIIAFLWVYSGMQSPLSWTDIPDNPTAAQYFEVFLSPDFAAAGSRFQEALIFLTVAVLIAIVMRRARQTVRRQLEAEQEMASVSQMFGQFVPKSVANSMIENKGVLDPTERIATVMFCDLAGFTKLMESKGPRTIVDTLNEFFDDASRIIGENNGVVTQFQGDGILATFNVPIEDENHAQNALNAADALLRLVEDNRYGNETLELRVGISTGQLIAGSVGGGGRQTYTVYGNPVNLAARLENLNKTYATHLLVSQSTVDLLPDNDLKPIGAIDVRGVREPVDVYTR